MQRRSVLQLATTGIVGASRWRSDRAREGASEEAVSGDDAGSDPADFDPGVHGFGFSNWAGDVGEGANGEQFNYEPTDITRDDVQRTIDETWATEITAAREKLMVRIVYSWIGGQAATNGHCYGMVFSAEEYFRDPSKLPAGVGEASEIPRPTDEYNDVGDRIRRFQTSQILRAEPFWYAFLGLRWGLANHRESLRQLTDALDADGIGGVALNGEETPHQVLAHGYERSGSVTDVFVYDPNYPATEYDDPGGIWTLSVDGETGDVLEIEEGYDEFLYHSPEMGTTAADRLIDGRDRLLEKLSNAVFLGLETGGSLDIDVPEDVLVDRPTAEYADPSTAPYADAAVVFGSVEEFDVSIDGETGEEYSVDALGLRDGELVLETVVSDTLGEVPARVRIRANDAGELVVGAVEGVQEGVKTAAEEGAEEITEERPDEGVEEATERTDWIKDNWWVAVAGGVLGLGAAFRYLVGSSDDERE